MADQKIMHLRSGSFYGGPERQLHHHALAMKDSSFSIAIASFSEDGQKPSFLDTIAADDIAIHHFVTSSSYDARAVGLLRRYLVEEKIGILCTHDYRADLIGMLARRGTSAKWLAFSRGWTRENLKTRLFHAVDKIIIRSADHIVAVSAMQKEWLVRLKVPPSKISVVHNCINPTHFASVEAANLRDRFDLPEDSLTVVSGGRFSSEKGQGFFVRAAEQALAKNRRLHFMLFGEGQERERIERLIESKGCQDRILCPGFEPNLASCLKGADMLVNPSQSEGLPNIVLEAMAMDLPVIATAVGGVPELIEDGIDGILVKYGDQANLTSAILRLADDADYRTALVRKAKQTVEERFSFDQQASALTRIYQGMTP